MQTRYFIKGIELRPTTDETNLVDGNILVNSSDKKFKAYLDGALREVLTNNQVQTITNKTIDATANTISNLGVSNLAAGVLDTDISTTSASDDTIPSAKAVKTYVDTRIQSKDEASEIAVNPAVNGQTNVQTALEDHETRIDATEAHVAASSGVHGVTGSVVGTSDSQTLSNKNLSDSTTYVVDAADATKKIGFDAAGTTGTKTVIQSSQTADRVITLPDVSDTLVGVGATQTLTNKTLTNPTISQINNGGAVTIPSGVTTLVGNNTTQTLTNKALVDASTTIVGSADATKKFAFENNPATTGTTLTLQASQTVNRVITFPDSSDTLVVLGLAQTLVNKTLTAPVLNSPSIVTPSRSDVKQGTKSALQTYASTASNGQLVFATDTKEYLAVKDGVLVDIGSGGSGVGGTDIMSADTADKAAVTDYTQTGLEIIDTIVLHGTQSFRLQHTTSIKSAKKTIGVDRKFRGKNMTCWIDVMSTATQGNLNVLFYDETNAQNLVASQQITTNSQAITATTANASASLTGLSSADFNKLKVGMVITGSAIPVGTTITALNTSNLTATMSANATGVSTGIRISALPNKATFTFNVPNNCQSLSWTISTVVENYAETYYDDIVLQLTQSPMSSASITTTTFNATDWTSYTPTFTGFGTPTAVEFEWRQVGANYEIRGKFVSGTPTATEARISLPNGATSAGTAIIPSTQLIGTWTANNANTYFGTTLISPSVTYINFGLSGSGTTGPTPLNASTLVGSGATMMVTASVPISGLTANTTTTNTIPLTSSVLVTQPDSAIELNTANGFGSTATTTRRFSNVPVNIGSAISYVDSPTLGGQFIINEDSDYNIVYTDSGTTTTDVIIKVNGVTKGISSSSGVNARMTSVFSGYLVKNDIITFTRDAASTGSVPADTRATITKVGSSKIINPSSDQKIQIPTHQLRFEGASARGSTDTAIVKFDTQTITQGDGFTVVNTAANGTVVTIRKAGILTVTATLASATTGQDIRISKNQAVLTALATTAETIAYSTQASANACQTLTGTTPVNVGDVIRVSFSATPNTSGNLFLLSLQETSVAVALQNVTPTYDNSDSTIQLRTANGYGSTNTKIRRFSNTVQNFGSDIVYTDDASLGASFTVQKDGEYQIGYVDFFSGGSFVGITKNTTQPTVSISALTNPSEVLSVSQTATVNSITNASWSGYLLKGDVIRAHTEGMSSGTQGTFDAKFTISRVGKTSGTVDVTPFVQIPQNDVEVMELNGNGFASTSTAVFRFNARKNTNKGIIQLLDDSTNGSYFKALRDCTINFSYTGSYSSSGAPNYDIVKNGTGTITAGTPSATSVLALSSVTTAGRSVISASINLSAGENFYLHRESTTGLVNDATTIATLTATAQSNSIATPTQQVSSDTMSFVFKSTALDPATDPVGTFNTYTYAANTNTATIATSAPTQTTASMNTNGIQVFARAYNASSTAASPARVDIFIGKGLKSKQVDAYFSSGKLDQLNYDLVLDAAFSNLYGTQVSYNETSGILVISSGINGTAVTNRQIGTNTTTGAVGTSGYFVFNASKSPSLVTVPQLQQRVAYLSDVKASATDGGSSVATTWTTRTLNTLVDNTGFVTSLSANQFTLPAGTYQARGFGMTFGAGNTSKLRLRNITDGTTSVIGSSNYSLTGGQVGNVTNVIEGEFTITTSKTFALQYYSTTAQANNGLGVSTASGENELFAQVAITKIK